MAGDTITIIIKNNDGSIKLAEDTMNLPFYIIDTGVKDYHDTIIYTYSGDSTFLGLSTSPNQTIPDENLAVGSTIWDANMPTNIYYIVERKETTSNKGNFINYIVSNDPNKYPANGEQGGYYYQKFDSSTLIPSNIRQGINIFGVDGELEEVVVTIDGVKQSGILNLITSSKTNIKMPSLPYDFYRGGAIMFNDEIHLFGGIGDMTAHYKCSNGVWSRASTLPFNYAYFNPVIYRNELHLVCGNSTNKHYKWNGSSWTSVATLGYGNLSKSAIVVYNDKIHLFGGAASDGSYSNLYWIFNGTSWKNSGIGAPNSMQDASAVVYNDEINILYNSNHWKKNADNSWTKVSSLPYHFDQGDAVVKDNELHILGSRNSPLMHQKWNGTEWSDAGSLPYSFRYGRCVVQNDKMHILGSDYDSNCYKNHYVINETSYIIV